MGTAERLRNCGLGGQAGGGHRETWGSLLRGGEASAAPWLTARVVPSSSPCPTPDHDQP